MSPCHVATMSLRLVLVSPQIPWNVGAIGRTSVALNAELIVVGPCELNFHDDAQIKRAGLDYWEFVKLKEYANWQEFLAAEKPADEELFFLSTKAQQFYYEAKFVPNSYLVFGSETAGLPKEIHETYQQRFYKMPMYSEKIRSLNLANSATAVAYEALRQNL